MGEGEKTKFFVNGIFVGQTNRRDQSDLYYIENSSGDEVFAEFIDDVRIYKALSLTVKLGRSMVEVLVICLPPFK